MPVRSLVLGWRRRMLAAGLTAAVVLSLVGACRDGGGSSRRPLPPPVPLPPTGIAFISDRDNGPGEIYTMNTNGTGVQRLTFDGALDFLLAISPDGTRLAFTRDTGAWYHIFSMYIDGTDLTQLTFGAHDNLYPTFNWDGTQIAFVRDKTFSTYGYGFDIHIWRMHANGSNPRQISGGNFVDLDPSWARGRNKIVFARSQGSFYYYYYYYYYYYSDTDIWTMNGDGSGKRRLTASFESDREPDFIFDGSEIVFVRTDYYYAQDLWAIDADGTGLRQITFSPSIEEYEPAFSPDGLSIAFGQLSAADGWEIYSMDAAGGGLQNLTNDPAIDRYPVWLR